MLRPMFTLVSVAEFHSKDLTFMNNLVINKETRKDISPFLSLANNPNIRGIRIMVNQSISEMFKLGNLKDIPGYENLYAVSRDGRVWAYPNRRNKLEGMWMNLQLMINTKNRIKPHKQYLVKLYKQKKYKNKQVHRLVGLTYIPNPENKPDVNHIDGDSLNNWDWNLEWNTKLENMAHAVAFGLIAPHSGNQDITRSRNGKLTGAINGMKSRRMFTMEEAECIRNTHRIGKKSCRAMAQVYNCSNGTISNICNDKTYIRRTP